MTADREDLRLERTGRTHRREWIDYAEEIVGAWHQCYELRPQSLREMKDAGNGSRHWKSDRLRERPEPTGPVERLVDLHADPCFNGRMEVSHHSATLGCSYGCMANLVIAVTSATGFRKQTQAGRPLIERICALD